MITPIDIENKRFGKKLNGYNADEVDDFLDEIIIDYEKVIKENADLKRELERKITKPANPEIMAKSSIEEAVLIAKTAAEESKEVAKMQADTIVKDAEITAALREKELEIAVTEKRRELEMIKKDMGVYKAKMEALLIGQLELIKDSERE